MSTAAQLEISRRTTTSIGNICSRSYVLLLPVAERQYEIRFATLRPKLRHSIVSCSVTQYFWLNSDTMATEEPFNPSLGHLGQLPPEVRNMIWEHLSYVAFPSNGAQKHRWYSIMNKPQSTFSRSFGIYRTSRQIKDELSFYITRFYESETMEFQLGHPDLDVHSRPSFVAAIGVKFDTNRPERGNF